MGPTLLCQRMKGPNNKLHPESRWLEGDPKKTRIEVVKLRG